jgi:hypothetical protein
MKTRLLKRLRKRFILQTRNGKHRVLDRQLYLADVYCHVAWVDLPTALIIRRRWILKEAYAYLEMKRVSGC